VTRCNVMEFPKKPPTSPPVSSCGVSSGEFPPDSIPDATEARMTDFLDGTTHGEDLLHALYDHILDEPIPERMRALFKE
jgi:hypothetical protein